ncbi:MAG TPA: hypothetical protein VM616_01405 [Gammaproteobacteria bacterium]|nr:hypothetical protein [Gammaproteobacteria bacterium]
MQNLQHACVERREHPPRRLLGVRVGGLEQVREYPRRRTGRQRDADEQPLACAGFECEPFRARTVREKCALLAVRQLDGNGIVERLIGRLEPPAAEPRPGEPARAQTLSVIRMVRRREIALPSPVQAGSATARAQSRAARLIP